MIPAQPPTAQDATSPVSVMHVITGLAVGGAESMLTSLLLAEQKMFPGETQRVISLSTGGPNADKLRRAGINVTELRMRATSPPGWGLFRLARYIWREKPAVVQTWMYHADLAATLALYWSDRRRHTRLIWGLRCSDMDTQYYGLRLSAVIRSCVMLSSAPNAIVSNSVAGQAYHVGLGYPERRCVVIPNGIDVDRFKPDPQLRAQVREELGISPDEPVVAHVARVDPMKDHRCFLEAIRSLTSVKALLIGQGTEALPAQSNVYRLGRRHDVPRLLTAADLIVSSSAFGEGFSNALAEGMAAGLPAVATDTGDARLLIGDTGRIVPPRSASALAAAISSLFHETKGELRARSEGARARIVDRFSLQRAVLEFRDLYRVA
jgi:glycosyltransferase involved in cell wall biosynthesis